AVRAGLVHPCSAVHAPAVQGSIRTPAVELRVDQGCGVVGNRVAEAARPGDVDALAVEGRGVGAPPGLNQGTTSAGAVVIRCTSREVMGVCGRRGANLRE